MDAANRSDEGNFASLKDDRFQIAPFDAPEGPSKANTAQKMKLARSLTDLHSSDGARSLEKPGNTSGLLDMKRVQNNNSGRNKPGTSDTLEKTKMLDLKKMLTFTRKKSIKDLAALPG